MTTDAVRPIVISKTFTAGDFRWQIDDHHFLPKLRLKANVTTNNSRRLFVSSNEFGSIFITELFDKYL